MALARARPARVRAAVHKRCLHVFKKRSFVSADTVAGIVRGKDARARTQRHLQALCKSRKITRAGRGQYVPEFPLTAESAVPTQVFPYQGSKRKMATVLASVLQNEMVIGKCRSILSTFAGTGVVEGTLRNLGVPVRAVDLNCNIVNVHAALKTSRSRAAVIKRFRSEATALRGCKTDMAKKRRFRNVLRDGVLKSRRTEGCSLAAARWILGQKMAYLGMLTSTSTLALDRLASLDVAQATKQVANHRGLGDRCFYKDAFQAVRDVHPSQLLFLDPPYLCDKQPVEGAKCRQYSAGDFGLEQHKELAQLLKGKRFVLCHRDSPAIRELYANCDIITAAPIMNLNRAGACRNELLIVGRP